MFRTIRAAGLILALALVVAGCCLPDDSAKNINTYRPTLAVAEAGQAAPVEVAEILIGRWLEHFRSGQVACQEQLDGYEIHEVRLGREQGNEFTFTLSFSVKPTSCHSDWIAGNGTLSEDGWMRYKFLFITIHREKDAYRLGDMGTGP